MSKTSSDRLKLALQALNSINDCLDQTSETLSTTLEMAMVGELPTQSGLTFLEVKNHTLEQYLMDLQFLMLSKCEESTVLRPSIVERLTESRVVLEKLRPIETKLRFQIDKTIKSSVVTDDGEAKLLQYKPRLENLNIQIEKDDKAESEVDEKKSKRSRDSKQNIYRPPKLLPMPYEEEDIDKPQKRVDARKKEISARMVQELKEDLLDVPIEITEGSLAMKMQNKQEKKRINFEESNYTRIPVTKKDKQKRAMSRNANTLDSEFRDIGSRQALSKKKGKKIKRKGRK